MLCALAIGLIVVWRVAVSNSSSQNPPPFVWPGASGLVAAWRSGWSEDQVKGPGNQPASHYKLAKHGDVGRGKRNELLFTNGWVDMAGVDKDLLAACQRTNQFTLEFTLASKVVRTERAEPIVALGSNPRTLDFLLAQDGDRLICQLRTSRTPKNAAPPNIDLSWFGAGFWRHMVISYRPGEFVCYLDGHMMKQLTDIQGDLGTWTAQPLVLAHKGKGKRSWRGEIERIAVFNRFIDEDEAERRFASFRDGLPHESK